MADTVIHQRGKPWQIAAVMVCLVLGWLMLGAMGLQLQHRYSLWVHDYQRAAYASHVADGFFRLMYQTAGCAGILAVAGGILGWRKKWPVIPAGLLLIGAVAAAWAFAFMHDRHMLVEYSEFIRAMGRG